MDADELGTFHIMQGIILVKKESVLFVTTYYLLVTSYHLLFTVTNSDRLLIANYLRFGAY